MVCSIALPDISVVRTLYIPPASFVTVPAATAASSNWVLNSTVAILASSIDFQSTNLTYPALKAWAKLYIALDASSELARARAAALLIPFIEATAVSSLTPAFVNFPIFEVILANE